MAGKVSSLLGIYTHHTYGYPNATAKVLDM